MALKEALDDLMIDEDSTKDDVKDFFMKIFDKLKVNYESKLKELEQRFTDKSKPKDKSKTDISKVDSLEIDLFVVKTFKGLGCKYCDSLISGDDKDKSIEWLRNGIVEELGLPRNKYMLNIIPCDWNIVEALPSDHPVYINPVTEEGINWYWMRSLEIEGFPSIRIRVKTTSNDILEQIIDGIGVKKEGEWRFGIRDIVLSFLEQSSNVKHMIDDMTHRDQSNGSLKKH